MILGCAERVFTALLAHEADNLAHVILASLVVAAVVVLLAFDLSADFSVVVESLLALALGVVVSRNALSISTAQESTSAHVFALRSSVGADSTLLANLAVIVRVALGLLYANVVLAELEVGTGRVALASRLTDAGDAELVGQAVARCRANRCADSVVAFRRSWTLIVSAAVLQLNAAEKRISSCSRLT